MEDGNGVQRYIFVHRLDRRSPLEKRIPLHVTLLHWFENDEPPEALAESMRKALHSVEPITVQATNEDMFGPNHDVPVTRLERTPELLSLHLALLGLAKSSGGRLDERWTGEQNWNPHVTHTPDARLHIGETVTITDVDLIVGSPDGSRELIVSVTLEQSND